MLYSALAGNPAGVVGPRADWDELKGAQSVEHSMQYLGHSYTYFEIIRCISKFKFIQPYVEWEGGP